MVLGATLQISSSSCLGANCGPITLDAGTLQAGDTLDIPSTAVIEVAAGGARFDSNGFVMTIYAPVGMTGDSGGVTTADTSLGKTGSVIFTNDNPYAGGTVVSSGTFVVTSTNEALLDGTSLTVGPGATIILTTLDAFEAPTPAAAQVRKTRFVRL